MVESLQGLGIEGIKCFAEHTMALTVPMEAHDTGVFDPHSQSRLERRVKELEVKLRKATLVSEEAESRLEQSKSAFLELNQNVERLQRQNEALLQERVQLYMEKQNLESALSVATTDKENLDKELVSLVNMPTRLAEISSQGVRQIACGDSHTLALAESGDVYAWGGGRSGQLGLGKRRSYPAPQV